jgi:hypothetical protein
LKISGIFVTGSDICKRKNIQCMFLGSKRNVFGSV